jgi:hypothetical protein
MSLSKLYIVEHRDSQLERRIAGSELSGVIAPLLDLRGVRQFPDVRA